MTHDSPWRRGINRRGVLRGAAAAVAGVGSLASPWNRNVEAASKKLSVLSPLPPDPAPPGVASYSAAAFTDWKHAYRVTVQYDAAAWSQLHDKMAANFAAGQHVHDLVYMSSWAPEFSHFLTPIADIVPAELKADLPPSSFNGVTWDGAGYGVVFTLSLLTMFFNTEHLSRAGIQKPPATWDELKVQAKELTRDGRYGWVSNYGQPAGIGGTASYWMAFLQQAGGKMYGDDGMPAFNDAPGVDALQLMLDLLPYSDPSSLANMGINDATSAMMAGTATMMMNWPFMWKPAQDPKISTISGKLGSAMLPAGPAGTASIDGSDAWTIVADTKSPELAMKLIEFYLQPDVQKRQLIDTGWLPIRMSVLQDPEVQAAAPNAAVALDQARHPYDSFVTPDYAAVTTALGTEIQKALQGQKTAQAAMKDGSDAVSSIVGKRPRA